MAEIPFATAQWIEAQVRHVAATVEGLGPDFDPQVRPADPRFGDFQVNGVLPHAKRAKANPRQLGQALLDALNASGAFPAEQVRIELAGPGFLNFALQPAFLSQWLQTYGEAPAFKAGAGGLLAGQKVVVDFPSANVAKQAHIGHLRPMVIGEAVARLLEFCGAETVRDNHIGDWGTNFGTLIMQLKHTGTDLDIQGGQEALATLDQLYKDGSAREKAVPELREVSRNELVKLQQGDPENVALWQQIVAVSLAAFDELFAQLGVRVDVTLGESFYRDQVERVYRELTDAGIAEESDGALVVWHDEVKKFARDNERPYPFNIRKQDGASNYGSTDLATVLYRVEHFQADQIVYLTDFRQQDHFEQLFLTVKKWFSAQGYPKPLLQHVWWGTILGPDKKPFKTKSGESIKLQSLLDEAVARARAIVEAKTQERGETLTEDELATIARAVGIGALKYADLSINRTQDYVFSWDKLLNFEGNTAPYLQYAGARIRSIFRKAEAAINDPARDATAAPLETEEELALARKLLAFPATLAQALPELRPHHLCTYLFELAGQFSSFYTANQVLVEGPAVRAKRLMLCARTVTVLDTGLNLLGIEPLERM